MKSKFSTFSHLIRFLFICSSAAITLLVIFFVISSIVSKRFSETKFYRKQLIRHATTPEIVYKSIEKLLSEGTMEIDDAQHIRIMLATHIHEHPSDPNIGYYALKLGELYAKHSMLPSALFYLHYASGHPPAPHYFAYSQKDSRLEALSFALSPQFSEIISPFRAIEYAEFLRTHYGTDVSSSGIDLTMGKHYEKWGQWERAYSFYDRFVRHSSQWDSGASERTELYFRLARRNRNDLKHRMWNTPEEARSAIRRALYNRSYRLLTILRAPKFFMAHWQEDVLDPNSHIPRFRIDVVLNRSNLQMQKDFSPYSTKTIKYWKTTGWERVSTWFFVFRKIYQPDIPDINGKWEWAGIYLGIGDTIQVTR